MGSAPSDPAVAGVTIASVHSLGGTAFRWLFNGTIVRDSSRILRSEWTVGGFAATGNIIPSGTTGVILSHPGAPTSGANATVVDYPQGVGAGDTGPVLGGTVPLT